MYPFSWILNLTQKIVGNHNILQKSEKGEQSVIT